MVGQHVPQILNFTVSLLLANLGVSQEQVRVGYFYELGYGVKKDISKAFYWYKRSSRKGNPYAYANLGMLYEDGKIERKNAKEAVFYYKKAAQSGHAWSAHTLGCWYTSGENVKQDYEEALKWFVKGAENGHASSMYNLSNAYYWGLGVDPDMSIAAQYCALAAGKGHEEAARALDRFHELGIYEDRTEKHQLPHETFGGQYSENETRVHGADIHKQLSPLNKGIAYLYFIIGFFAVGASLSSNDSLGSALIVLVAVMVLGTAHYHNKIWAMGVSLVLVVSSIVVGIIPSISG